MALNQDKELSPLQKKVHRIIFGTETPTGKIFDIALLILILLSVVTVMLETVSSIQVRYAKLFYALEWGFTIVFTIEYLLRLYTVKRPMQYAGSFFGVVDLLSILPTYISLFFVGTHYLSVIRALRLLRVFRIFKLGHFMKEGTIIIEAMKASRPKIMVFLFFVTVMVTIFGSVMYLIEGGQNPDFTSIPRSVYWAIVTLTTVGYGDITPQTEFGQFISALVMILGYSVIAVPTGIVTNELINSDARSIHHVSCYGCASEGHDYDAKFCKYCGERLPAN